MHLVVGFLNVLMANFLASIYRIAPVDFIGRAAIRRSCAAFVAGAGMDDAAVEVIRRMGADGSRLLEAEAKRLGQHSIAGILFSILQMSKHA